MEEKTNKSTKPIEVDIEVINNSDIENKKKKLKEIKKSNACKEYKILTTLTKPSHFNTGIIFRNKETSEIIGFTLFTYGRHKDIGYIQGNLRCSSVKGVGRIIQEMMEEFAKVNEIQFIRIEAIDDLEKYYKEKFGYISLDFDPRGLYKIIDDTFDPELIKTVVELENTKGGARRKTRSLKKKLRFKTRKNK